MTDTAEQKAAAAEKAQAKKKAKEEPWLVVTGPERGRRRAGVTFGPAPVALRIADLPDEAVTAIKGDPQLAAAVEMRPEEVAAGDA